MRGASPYNSQAWNCPRLSQFLLYGLLVCMPLLVVSGYDWVVSAYAGVASHNPRVRHAAEARGPTNHALFSNGARIIDSLTSPNKPVPISNLYSSSFSDHDVGLQVRGSHGPESAPEIVLGLFSDPRALWFFDGSYGYVTIALANPICVGTIRLHSHIVDQPCLPRHVNLWGLVPSPVSKRVPWNLFDWPGGLPAHLLKPFESPAERSFFTRSASASWIPLGHSHNVSRTGNHTEISLSAKLQAHKLGVHVVSIEFKENWGAPYTCFTGLSIYDSGDI